MSAKKHSDSAIDLNVPYEQNEIQLKGIIGFGIGLLLLIVITFGLMWALLYKVMPTVDLGRGDTRPNPIAMTDKERLPPEPRLQLAPGFGIESETGRVNLELEAPAAEYLEFKKQSDHLLKFGRKDERTGLVSAMPIEMAKEKYLAQNPKATNAPDAVEIADRSRTYVTDQSSGRVAGEKRR